jgi:hypothetical protein
MALVGKQPWITPRHFPLGPVRIRLAVRADVYAFAVYLFKGSAALSVKLYMFAGREYWKAI